MWLLVSILYLMQYRWEPETSGHWTNIHKDARATKLKGHTLTVNINKQQENVDAKHQYAGKLISHACALLSSL